MSHKYSACCALLKLLSSYLFSCSDGTLGSHFVQGRFRLFRCSKHLLPGKLFSNILASSNLTRQRSPPCVQERKHRTKQTLLRSLIFQPKQAHLLLITTPPTSGHHYPLLSLPSLANSTVTKSSAFTISVLPYTTLRRGPTLPPPPAPALVLFAQSCKLPYSSILPPPTVNTIASLNPCLRCPNVALLPGPRPPRPPDCCCCRAWLGAGIVPRALAERGSK